MSFILSDLEGKSNQHKSLVKLGGWVQVSGDTDLGDRESYSGTSILWIIGKSTGYAQSTGVLTSKIIS